MFIYDLSEQNDFFCSTFEMDLRFIHYLFYRKILLQSSGIWDDAVRTELVASGGNRDICRDLVSDIHRGIDSLRNDLLIFIDDLLIVFYLILKFLKYKRKESGIIYPPHKLKIWIGFTQSVKCRIKRVIDEDEFSISSFQFSIIIDLICSESNDFWIFRGDRS
jgi:hypothetical protein